MLLRTGETLYLLSWVCFLWRGRAWRKSLQNLTVSENEREQIFEEETTMKGEKHRRIWRYLQRSRVYPVRASQRKRQEEALRAGAQCYGEKGLPILGA